MPELISSRNYPLKSCTVHTVRNSFIPDESPGKTLLQTLSDPVFTQSESPSLSLNSLSHCLTDNDQGRYLPKAEPVYFAVLPGSNLKRCAGRNSWVAELFYISKLSENDL
ncbi:hypothetical protein CDG61_12145 [Acinetobacter sp. WCHAc010052]|nr:hypothetical protein CDG61_12145 [Acinetobacter sp. WCHAc010052]